MQLIPIIYLSYMFVSLYMLFFFLILYLKNKNRMFDVPKPTKEYTVSIVVPCYNEEKSILDTVKSILASDYKGLKKVIVVDDCSTDNSYNVVKQFAKQEGRVLVVRTWGERQAQKTMGQNLPILI